MRQLSFFRCWYFFSLMSAEAAEADAVRYAALVPAEVGTCASQRLTSELAHRSLLDLLRCGQAGSAASKERWICPCAKLMDGQFPPMWRRMKGKPVAGILSRRLEGRARHMLWLRGFKFRNEREAREHAERVITKIRGVTGEGVPIPS